MGELRALFARPVVRAIFVATACGSAVMRLAEYTIHGFMITPLAYSADLNHQQFDLFPIIGGYSSTPATLAGRDVDWLDPMSAAIVLILVVTAAVLVLRATR